MSNPSFGAQLVAYLAPLHRTESLSRDPPRECTCSTEPTMEAQRPLWKIKTMGWASKFGGTRTVFYEAACRNCDATAEFTDDAGELVLPPRER